MQEELSEQAAGIELAAFRAAFGEIAMPVGIVTAFHHGKPHGTTVSSFCSLSSSPPLVLVALDNGSRTLEVIQASGRFGVNVLSTGQESVATRCATKEMGKFDGMEWELDDGLPRIAGAAVWLACDLSADHCGGDHRMLSGLIVGSAVEPRTPMAYHRRGFGTVTTLDAAELSAAGRPRAGR